MDECMCVWDTHIYLLTWPRVRGAGGLRAAQVKCMITDLGEGGISVLFFGCYLGFVLTSLSYLFILLFCSFDAKNTISLRRLLRTLFYMYLVHYQLVITT